MANTSYELGGKTFLKCKECGEFKEVCNDNRYKHKDGYLGVLGRCKECIKTGRKTERELLMARKRDYKRYHNNPKRKEDVFKSSKKRVLKHKEEFEGWDRNHLRVDRLIKRLGIRPNTCPICGYKGRIIAHHPDIKIRYEIVFCCQPCHSKIHKGELSNYETLNLLNS